MNLPKPSQAQIMQSSLILYCLIEYLTLIIFKLFWFLYPQKIPVLPGALREVQVTIPEAGIRHPGEVGHHGLSPVHPRARAPQPPPPWGQWSRSIIRWPQDQVQPLFLSSHPLPLTMSSLRFPSPLWPRMEKAKMERVSVNIKWTSLRKIHNVYFV